MGPPEFTGGNARRHDESVCWHGYASMGPPEFTGGNSVPYTSVSGRPQGFNGAAGIHRRKPVRRAAGGRPEADASMGPPEFTGGNVSTSSPSDRSRLRFNGAAGIHRRKHVRAGRKGGRPYGCFNGAAGIHRRKQKIIFIFNSKIIMLQWGRRNSPAETCVARGAGRSYRVQASMGPPEFTGGNKRPSCRPRHRRRGFNGAAGIHRRKQ